MSRMSLFTFKAQMTLRLTSWVEAELSYTIFVTAHLDIIKNLLEGKN